MSMIVARMQKMKAENLVGIGNHNQRKTQNHSNKDIDVERSHWNYDLVEGRTRPILKGSPDELKMLLSAPEAYSWPDLRKNVLNRAIDEINLQIDDMDLQLNVGKRGRKVIHVEIANLFYPRKPNLHDEDFEPVPMVDWMKDFK